MKVRFNRLLTLACVAGVLASAVHPVSTANADAVPTPACSWGSNADDDFINAAYPDTEANYWLAQLMQVPSTRIAIRGAYPEARYFSLHVYDQAQRPIDSLADYEIVPDKGSANPFASSVSSKGAGTYTVFVEFTAEPQDPAPNTIYAGATGEGLPNPTSALIYRTYVPDDPKDGLGGVPLPTISYETADGTEVVGFEDCQVFTAPSDGTVNQAIRDSSYPDDIPRLPPRPNDEKKPRFNRFYGVDRPVYDNVPPNPVTGEEPKTQGGFLSNEQNAYMTARITRSMGDIVVIRAKAPSFPDTRKGESLRPPSELRYWSMCQNHTLSQRVVACAADFQTEVGRDGYFTFVISDPADRPSNANAKSEVTWLPWGGPFYEATIIYRHMLPSRGFDEAVQNIPEGEDPTKIMGVYYPRAVYCDKAAFEKSGWRGCRGLPGAR